MCVARDNISPTQEASDECEHVMTSRGWQSGSTKRVSCRTLGCCRRAGQRYSLALPWSVEPLNRAWNGATSKLPHLVVATFCGDLGRRVSGGEEVVDHRRGA